MCVGKAKHVVQLVARHITDVLQQVGFLRSSKSQFLPSHVLTWMGKLLLLHHRCVQLHPVSVAHIVTKWIELALTIDAH